MPNFRSLAVSRTKSVALVGALSTFVFASSAQAETYSISARFIDGGIQHETLFNGTFSWESGMLNSFSGQLTQSMWAWNASTGQYVTGMGGNTVASLQGTGPGGGLPPVLNLTYQLGGVTAPDVNGDVLATVFLVNSTNVFSGGGFNLAAADANGWLKYGNTGVAADGNTANQNAFFTLAFKASDPTDVATSLGKIGYGDCTPRGLMAPMMTGNVCMSGYSGGGAMMAASPTSLMVTAVPEPETYAMLMAGLGFVGVIARRRKARAA